MIGAPSQRRRMVAEQIARRGITDANVLAAMRRVPREAFVPDHLASRAYADTPLPIACGQTISQPFVVALMIEGLDLTKDARVLEVGSGSGYALAVMAEIAANVYGVERHAPLAGAARERLHDLGYENVEILCEDGSVGWPERAPYDAILVSAGAPRIPEVLRAQLAPGGSLVMPVGESRYTQELVRILREDAETYRRTSLGDVRFVPLIGHEGWPDDGA